MFKYSLCAKKDSYKVFRFPLPPLPKECLNSWKIVEIGDARNTRIFASDPAVVVVAANNQEEYSTFPILDHRPSPLGDSPFCT